MTFVDSIKTCFKKYADFNGRAARSEYWFFMLFTTVLMMVCSMVHTYAMLAALLGTLVPIIAVSIRRLHDIDKSGWFYLLSFVPFGSLVLLFFACQPGTAGDNKFGPPAA